MIPYTMDTAYIPSESVRLFTVVLRPDSSAAVPHRRRAHAVRRFRTKPCRKIRLPPHTLPKMSIGCAADMRW